MSNAVSLASFVLLVVPAFAQTAAYAHAPTAPGPASLLVWDSTRNRVVAVEGTPEQRLWDWDGASWAQRFGVPSAGTAGSVAAVYDRHRQIVVVLAGASNALVVREWNGAQWTVHNAPLPTSLTAASCTFDVQRRRLVVFGGNVVFEWDGAAWNTITPLNSPGLRTAPVLAYDPANQRCVLYGGLVSSTVMDDCWAWDGSDWTLLAANAPPGPRNGAGLAFEPTSGRMILFGGDAAPHTTWALQGASWTQIATSRDPGQRSRAQFVQDGTGLLLHGGSSPQVTELWRFSGNDWHVVADGSPAARYEGAFGWDPVRGEAVLFGGSAQIAYPWGYTSFDDTWTYNGSWHRHTLAVHPSARSLAAFAWSSADNAMLLFGGHPTAMNDTWTWDGSAWLQRTPANTPSPRLNMAMAQDPAGGVLLFGGTDPVGTTVFGDQWHWDGTNWLQQTPTPMPGARAYALATYDPLRNVLVLASGYSNQFLQDTWEWNGSQWAQRAATPFSIGGRVGRSCFRPDTGRVFVEVHTQYEWDGVSWTTIGPPGTNEDGAKVTGDLGRGRVLRFPLQNGLGMLTPTPAAGEHYGNGCAIGPAPGLTTIGRPRPGAAGFAITTATFAPGAPTLHAIGFASANQPLGSGCSLLVGQVVATQFGLAAANGTANYAVPLPPDNGLRGVVLHAQAAVVDPLRGLYGGLTISDGLRITIGD